MIKRLATSNKALCSVAASLMLIGVAVSLWKHDFAWLARFGALVVAVGILLIARPALIEQDIGLDIAMADTGLSHLDPEHWRKLGKPVPQYVLEDIQSRRAVGFLGPLVCFIGTVTNGFGSLLNCLLGTPP